MTWRGIDYVPRSIVAASVALIAACGAPLAWAESSCFSSDSPPPRYEIKNGEVHDSNTNLTWQRCSVGQRWTGESGCVGVIRQMNWRQAMKQADSRWQLPTKDELASLVTVECGSPAIDERAFPDMELTKLWYWSATNDGPLAWYVAFGGGSVRSGGPLDLNSVRLVRRGR
jgi:hypothetical protein